MFLGLEQFCVYHVNNLNTLFLLDYLALQLSLHSSGSSIGREGGGGTEALVGLEISLSYYRCQQDVILMS